MTGWFPGHFWFEVMQMLQPLKGGKAFQNLEVEGTELSEIVTWMKKEIQGKSGQVSQEFCNFEYFEKN